MKNSLILQELAIAIAAQNHSPTLLNPEFLKYSGIIPDDWQLAQAPVFNNTMAQMIFQNGVSILAQGNRVVFSETIAEKNPSDVQIEAIARKYIEALPQVKYQGIGINFRGHVAFDQGTQTASDYIFNTLLAPGPWQEFGTGKPQASLRLTYLLEQAQMDLEITQVGLRINQQDAIPAVLFTATIGHPVNLENPILDLGRVITAWQTDLEIFKDVVENRFLHTVSRPLDSDLKPVITVA